MTTDPQQPANTDPASEQPVTQPTAPASGPESTDASETNAAVGQPAATMPPSSDIAAAGNAAPNSSTEDVVVTPAAAEAATVAEEVAAVQPTAETTDSAVNAAMDADAAGRVRDKMKAAAEAQAEEASVPSTHRATSGGARTVEIPGVDDLEEGLEAEIQAVMQNSTVATPVVQTEGSAQESQEVSLGSKVKGTIQQIHGDDVFLDAGLRTNVVVSLKQFPEGKPPEVGAQIDVVIEELDADGLIRGRLPKGRHKPAGNWDNLAVGQVVDCMVTAVNKGGLQVTVGGLRAFMPASQVELGFAGDLESYVGQKISCQITEVNPKKRNLVVSRRALLQSEREESEGEFWTQAEVGQDYSGVVKTIKDYGAFINIGAVDGFLHIGEISWSRINHPSDVLQEGQTVDVKVLRLDAEKKRVSLGMKQLAQNPWATATEKYSTGRTVSGTVSRVTDFGAFIELEPGLEGMVHISELAWRRVGSVSEILNVGDTREFQVQDVDTKRKRVSLSLKALEKRPETAAPERAEEAEATPEPRRPRNTNLRGGTSSDDDGRKGGGLFGNPSDFT